MLGVQFIIRNPPNFSVEIIRKKTHLSPYRGAVRPEHRFFSVFHFCNVRHFRRRGDGHISHGEASQQRSMKGISRNRGPIFQLFRKKMLRTWSLVMDQPWDSPHFCCRNGRYIYIHWSSWLCAVSSKSIWKEVNFQIGPSWFSLCAFFGCSRRVVDFN